MLRVIFAFILAALPLQAQEFPAPVTDTLNDYAQIFQPEDAAQMTQMLADLRARTGVHVVVATMNSMADYGGPTGGVNVTDPQILTFAKSLFNAWGIGDKQRNDGILVLLLLEERAVRIALGAGYDTVWDNNAQRVVNNTMVPHFSDGGYVEGLMVGVQDIEAQIITPFLAGSPPPAPPEDSGWDWSMILAFLPMVLFVGAFFIIKSIVRFARAMQRCESCGQRGISVSSHVVAGATDMMDGQGIHSYRCNHCGHSREVPYVISRSAQTSHSSHDSGFDGGSSSGGGATGRF